MQRSVAGLLTLAVTLFSLAITASGMAYDTVRWRTAQRLTAAGAPTEHVDGGLEWNGTHSSQRLALIGMIEFPSMVPCFLETATPAKVGSPYQVVPYRTFLLFGSSDLLVYNQDLPGCGTHNGTTAVTTETGVASTARIDAQGALWVATQARTSGPFTGWTRVGTAGGLAGAPAMLVSGAASGTQSVFVRTTAGAIGYYAHTASGWQDRQLLSGGPVFTGDPAVVLTAEGGMSVSALDAAGDVWVDTQVLPGTPFGGWQRVSTGGGQAGTPALALSPAAAGRRTSSSAPRRGRSPTSASPARAGAPGPCYPAARVRRRPGGDADHQGRHVDLRGGHRGRPLGGQPEGGRRALHGLAAGEHRRRPDRHAGDGALVGPRRYGEPLRPDGRRPDRPLRAERPRLAGPAAADRRPGLRPRPGGHGDGNGTMTVTAVDAAGNTWTDGEQSQGGPFTGWVKVS